MTQNLIWTIGRKAALIFGVGTILCLSNPSAESHLHELNKEHLQEFTYGDPWEWDAPKYLCSPACSAGWAKKGWKIEYHNYGLFSTTVRLGEGGRKVLSVGALYVALSLRRR